MTAPQIKTKAGILKAWIRSLTLPYGSKMLVDTLTLHFKPGSIHSRNQSAYKTCFIEGSISNDGILGEGQVTLDTSKFVKHLNLYPDDALITVNFGEVVTITSPQKTSTIYSEASSPTLPAGLPTYTDGVAVFRGGIHPTTFATVKADALNGLIRDAQAVEVVVFPMRFSEASNQAKIGSHETKHDMIETVFDATQVQTTGPAVSLQVGEDLVYVANNLDDTFKSRLQLKEGYPLVIQASKEREEYYYIISPQTARSDDDN